MGDDWQGAFDFLEVETTAKVLYLPRTPEVSTTQIKKNYIIVNNKKSPWYFSRRLFQDYPSQKSKIDQHCFADLLD